MAVDESAALDELFTFGGATAAGVRYDGVVPTEDDRLAAAIADTIDPNDTDADEKTKLLAEFILPEDGDEARRHAEDPAPLSEDARFAAAFAEAWRSHCDHGVNAGKPGPCPKDGGDSSGGPSHEDYYRAMKPSQLQHMIGLLQDSIDKGQDKEGLSSEALQAAYAAAKEKGLQGPTFPRLASKKPKKEEAKPAAAVAEDLRFDKEKPADPRVEKREKAPPEQHAAVVAKARAKLASVPPPTEKDLEEARAGIAEMGANKFRKKLVGNSNDRKKRRDELLREFGDGTVCPCLYCGAYVGDNLMGSLEQDKILTTAQGGRYRTKNLVPSCSDCNKKRSDMPFAEALEKVVSYAGS